MYPTFFRFQGQGFHMWGLLLMLGFTAAILLLNHRAKKVGIDPDLLVPFYQIAIVMSLVGSRLLHFVFAEPELFFSNHLVFIDANEGGFAFYGGAIGGAISCAWYLWWRKIPFWKLLDASAPSIMLGLALGRLGCFFAGCCHGRPTDAAQVGNLLTLQGGSVVLTDGPPFIAFNFVPGVGVGLDLQYGISFDSSLHAQIDTSLQEKWETLCPSGAPDQAACEEKAGLVAGRPGIGTSSVEVLATANVSIVPVIGKAMVFGNLMRYDMHLLFGAGVATLRAEGERAHIEEDLSIVPLAGIGFRLFLNDWISMNLEVRDLLMSYHRVTDQDGSKLDAEFMNHFELSWSLGFVLPQAPGITSVSD